MNDVNWSLATPTSQTLPPSVSEKRSAIRLEAKPKPPALLLTAETSDDITEYTMILSGQLRDVSQTGLAFFINGHKLGDYLLTHKELEVNLEFETKVVKICCTPVRCEQIIENGKEKGYLVGAKIISMSGIAHFVEYLHQLRKANQN